MSLVKAVWSTGNKKSSESPLDAGLSNYNILHHDYDQISDMRDIKGYHLHDIERPLLGEPTDETQRTTLSHSNANQLHYAYDLPYRACVTARPHHPGDLRH